MSRTLGTAALLCLVVWLAPVRARGNTVQDILGQGARAKAMGGTGTAAAKDSSSAYYNPAGLAACPGNEVSLSLSHLAYGLTVQSNDERAETATLRNRTAMSISGCVKLPARLHVGFIFDTGLQSAQRLEQSSLRSKPEFALYGNALEQVSLIAGLGFRINQKFSVGLGGAMLVNSGLGVGVSVPIVSGQEEIAGRVKWSLKPAMAVYAGARYRPTHAWTLGASVRTALFHKLESNVLTTVDVAGVLFDVNLLLESVAWYSPVQASLGATYERSGWLLSADLSWYHWSAYPGPFLHISPLDGSDSVAAALRYPPGEPPNFSDVIVPRLGAEYQVAKGLDLRAGLGYRQSPAPRPSPTGRSNLLDASAVRASVGLGYRAGAGSVSIYGRAEHMAEREVGKQLSDGSAVSYRFGGTNFDFGMEFSSSW